MRLRGIAEANPRGFLASLCAEFILSEILRSLPLRYAQGFVSPLRMTGSEGLRASVRNELRNLRKWSPRLRLAMTRPLPSKGVGMGGPPPLFSPLPSKGV